MIHRLVSSAALLLAVLLLSRCVVATSKHPASETHDPALDDRIVGWWSLRAPPDAELTDAEAAQMAEQRIRLLVGRAEEADRLEWLMVHLGEGDRIETTRGAFRVTALGEAWIVSRYPREDATDWWLSRVRWTPEGPVGYDDLDPEAVARAIEAGEIEGEVTRHPDGHLQHARLTADTPALRAWIATKGDSIWTGNALSVHWGRDPVPDLLGR